MDERLFRDAMGKFATGITVVSMYDKDETIGMTVNAFMSLSLDPMLVAVSIDERASMYDNFKSKKSFGISMLSESQQELSSYFARQIELDYDVKFLDQAGVPVIEGALANLSCETVQEVKAGDHKIFIAKVNDIAVNEGDPVIYFGSNYRYLKEK
ncbi:MAG TPA: flavin reductase family protein [Pseudogracilibacillus sp.]|nr:flavin reductase family protein [Pseudogracilibacillus sp.]